jgi:hypothetical protein
VSTEFRTFAVLGADVDSVSLVTERRIWDSECPEDDDTEGRDSSIG